MTQFDIIRQQAESAARNAAAGAVGRLRRDTSLVNQASQLTGRAIRKGEAAWKKRGFAGRRIFCTCRQHLTRGFILHGGKIL